MRSNRRVTVSGPLLAADLGAGGWRLARDEPGAAEILLYGLDAVAASMLTRGRIAQVVLEWNADGVGVELTTPMAQTRNLVARSALLHEPQPRLYEGLPLAGFDAKAKRFWWRIFAVMRLPGGRFLLRFLARRRRSR